MAGPEFFQTRMGQKFYEHDVPQISEALQALAKCVEPLQTIAKGLQRVPSLNPPFVAIYVKGGVVQSVHASPAGVQVEVFDMDLSDYSTPEEEKEVEDRQTEFERTIVGMEQVW